MMPCIILCAEPYLDNFLDLPGTHKPPAQAEHITVVVPASEPGAVAVAYRRRAHTGELVCRNAHPNAGATEQNTEIRFSQADGLRDLGRIVGITGGLLPAAAVHIGELLNFKQLQQM